MHRRFSWIVVTVGCAISVCANAQVRADNDRFGDAMRYLLPAAAVAITLHNDDIEGLKQFGYSALLTKGSTELLKHPTNSRRPNGEGLGFPSGHTAIAFASAAFVNKRYGLEPAMPMYALAALTGYSRVRTRNHFTKDVVGGAVVGIGSALIMTHALGPRSAASLNYARDALVINYSASW
jgi:membrane-associated phospholipid phosphatase